MVDGDAVLQTKFDISFYAHLVNLRVQTGVNVITLSPINVFFDLNLRKIEVNLLAD